MTRGDVDKHAKKYSQAYQRDLAKGWNSSRWSLDFDAMAKKTVIKQLLSKWGILSIDMQRAVADDQKVFDADGNGLYYDNPENDEEQQAEQVVDVFETAVAPAETEVVEQPKRESNQQQKKAATKPQAEPEPQLAQDEWNLTGGFGDDAALPWN
jgi:recombination protein RecT